MPEPIENAATGTTETPGQPPDSPPGTGIPTPGQPPESPTGSAASGEGSAASTDTDKPATPTTPLPFDQDPKWLSARAAEKQLTTILEQYGFDTADDLEEALESGVSLQELLGDRDAESLIESADTLSRYEDYWSKQEREKTLENETEVDTITRQERENQELRDKLQRVDDTNRETAESKTLLKDFNSAVSQVVKNSNLSDSESEMAQLLLGVDNPMNIIDIGNKSEVGNAATAILKKFSNFITDLKQTTVDEHVAGKSNITPISPIDTPPVTKQGVEIPDGVSVDDAFGLAHSSMLEVVKKAMG
jgi:hypothetical protein